METETWIPTYLGVKFDLIKPLPVDVRPHDITFALSNLRRFTGHVTYSVAQHSMMVADLVPPEMELFALLHDAAEAYTGDISRPLKKLLGGSFRVIERRVQDAVDRRFGLEWSPAIAAAVKQADDVALATERRDLFFSPPPFERKLPPPHDTEIVPQAASVVRSRFEERLAPLITSYHPA